MLFKLRPKVGDHVEPDKDGKPKIYKPGDTVESNQNLAKLFVGKFDRVDKDTEGSASHAVPDIPMPSEGVDLEQSASLPQPTKETTSPTEEDELEDAALESRS